MDEDIVCNVTVGACVSVSTYAAVIGEGILLCIFLWVVARHYTRTTRITFLKLIWLSLLFLRWRYLLRWFI